MSEHCTVSKRKQAQDIADQLAAQPQVAAVDVLSPAEGPCDEWTLSVLVGRTTLPPQVCLALGAHGLVVEPPVQTRASGHTEVVATVPR